MDIRLYVRKEGITSPVEVEELGVNLFRLTDNHLFDCRLTRGTEIKTEPMGDGSYEFIAVTKPSELITRRFFLSPKYRESDYRVLGEELSRQGGFWQVDFGGYLTINIPKNFPYDLDQVMADLDMRLTEMMDDLEQ